MARRFRSLTALIALAAIMLRALLPDGWMPNFSGTGASVVICTLNGIEHILIGPDGRPAKAPADQPGQSCHFMTATAFASLPGGPDVSAPLDAWAAMGTLSTHLVPRLAPLLDSRAPRPPPHLA